MDFRHRESLSRAFRQACPHAHQHNSSISILLRNINVLKFPGSPGPENERHFIELTVLEIFYNTEKALNAGERDGFSWQIRQHLAVGLGIS